MITQLNGRHLAGNSPEMIISGISRAYNNHFNPDQIAQDLNSGKYYLVSFGNCHAPLLRKVARVNDAQQDEETKAEWEIITNTHSEALTSDLKFLMQNVPKPAFVSATIRQEAKPENTAKASNGQQAKKETYWIDLECVYKDNQEFMVGLPYVVTFADGKTRKGKLGNGITRINNIVPGQVTVEFGYPEAETNLKAARKELKACLDEIICALEERAKPLDEALEKEGVPMKALILTGAFFDGLFGTLGDSAEGIAELAKDISNTARVKLDEWEGIAEEVKYETIEYIEEKKEAYLEFIAEVDEKRASVEDALNKSVKQFKKDLEELAAYADEKVDNAYAYGQDSIDDLTETYNHYALLFEDSEIGKMLKDFPGRYYDAMPKVEAAQAGGGVGFNVLTAIITGGTMTGAVVAGFVVSKLPLFSKAKKIIDKLLELLKQKKATPEKPITKGHNEKVEAKAEKPKEEKVEEKAKKKCQLCRKGYNAKCPMANPKISYPSELVGSGSELTKNIVASPTNDYSKIEDHPWHFTRVRQQSNGPADISSLQAHHLIISASMKNDDCKEMCDDYGYNINHYKNGVMLPYYQDLACHLKVPVHKSNHSKGESDLKGEEGPFNYPMAVNAMLADLVLLMEQGKLCKSSNPHKFFSKRINKVSKDILDKVKSYQWTITADGRDYHKDSLVGCGNSNKINKKEGNCHHRSNGTSHSFINSGGDEITAAQIKVLEVGG